MGTEPAPPCNYFKRLSVALERRRAVAARELTDWRQKRLQLQEVVWEASVAEKSNWPIDELCRVEADLDAVVGSDKPAIQKGYWNSSEVNSKINDLLQSLSISWEGHELQSFDKCLDYRLLPPDDAIEAGEVIAIASSKFGIYLVSLTKSKQCKASLSNESLKLISPVRLSFDQQKRLLVVLDRVSTANVFKIVLYKITVSVTTASLISFGNLWTDFNSRCVPSIFAQRSRVIVSVSAGDSSKLISISSDTNAPSTGRREIELSAPLFSSRAAGVVDICCLEDEDSISVFYENGFSDIVNWKSLQ
uniref:Nuclear pore complex protein n=1 Tax=Macrostomum lignano TaxID=282301 RepID=A0A1I8GQ67_9PLAT